jgi:hypothetical protein
MATTADDGLLTDLDLRHWASPYPGKDLDDRFERVVPAASILQTTPKYLRYFAIAAAPFGDNAVTRIPCHSTPVSDGSVDFVGSGPHET